MNHILLIALMFIGNFAFASEIIAFRPGTYTMNCDLNRDYCFGVTGPFKEVNLNLVSQDTNGWTLSGKWTTTENIGADKFEFSVTVTHYTAGDDFYHVLGTITHVESNTISKISIDELKSINDLNKIELIGPHIENGKSLLYPVLVIRPL